MVKKKVLFFQFELIIACISKSGDKLDVPIQTAICRQTAESLCCTGNLNTINSVSEQKQHIVIRTFYSNFIKIHSILVVLSITKPKSKKYTQDLGKGRVGVLESSRFFGESLCQQVLLTIQKDQLDHTARTGSRCRIRAKLVQRGLYV